MEKKQMDYQNGYIKEKYDRINVTLPKGRKEVYRQAAAAAGTSLNAIINKLLEEWSSNKAPAPAEPEEQEEPTAATRIETLNMLCEESINQLKEMGIITIGEYVARYLDDDPEDCMTYEEERRFHKFLGDNKLWQCNS